MRLQVDLPKNRWNTGRMTLLDDAGTLLFECQCKGKADNRRAERAGNDERDPKLPYGDTPSGDYAPTGLVRFAKPHPRLGWGWYPLHGATGDALRARFEGKRTGLGIHAGRGEQLMATYGCVRVKQSDFEELTFWTGDTTIEVTITDVG